MWGGGVGWCRIVGRGWLDCGAIVGVQQDIAVEMENADRNMLKGSENAM